MCAFPKEDPKPILDAHRLEMIRIGREVNARAGIPDPATLNVTVRELQEMQRKRGVRPEDNEGSRELMRMRYGISWVDGD